MKKCAYCLSTSKKLTREHIIPKGIIDLFPESDYVYGQNIPFKGESIIKDVCASCNNENLSDLDSYGKTLSRVIL